MKHFMIVMVLVLSACRTDGDGTDGAVEEYCDAVVAHDERCGNANAQTYEECLDAALVRAGDDCGLENMDMWMCSYELECGTPRMMAEALHYDEQPGVCVDGWALWQECLAVLSGGE